MLENMRKQGASLFIWLIFGILIAVFVINFGPQSPGAKQVRSYSGSVRVSPDGNRRAVVVRSLTEAGLWVYDLRRGVLTRLPSKDEVFLANVDAEGRPRGLRGGRERDVAPVLATRRR